MSRLKPQSWIELDKDSLIDYQFTKMAEEDEFSFVESCCSNRKFDIMRGDGKENIYLPVQHKDLRLNIKSIDMKALAIGAQQVYEVPEVQDREHLSGFGSDLDSKGILWVCVFNLNLLIGIQLPISGIREGCVLHTFRNIPAPNDICLSADESILYIATGKFVAKRIEDERLNGSEIRMIQPDITAPAYGQVYRIDIQRVLAEMNSLSKVDIAKYQHEIVLFSTDDASLTALAGIQCLNNKLWLTQLYDMRQIR